MLNPTHSVYVWPSIMSVPGGHRRTGIGTLSSSVSPNVEWQPFVVFRSWHCGKEERRLNARTVKVSVLDLLLDPANPRFVDMPGQSQEVIRKRLLDRENVIPLAKSIVSNHGLLPGERVVVCEEDGDYVVVEGNRRICACQLLLNPTLVPPSHKAMFPEAGPETIRNIRSIEVDVINDRAEALRFLVSRHIDGPLRWSAVAKIRFFVNQFQAGKSVDQIAHETGVRAGDVKKAIREHNLLEYAFELPCWTDKQRQQLNWASIEPSAFLRLFNTRGAKKKLGLYFDSCMRPRCSYGREVLDESIRLIALATLIDQNDGKKVSTRAELEDVPGLTEYLENLQRDSSQPRHPLPRLPLEWSPARSEILSRLTLPRKAITEKQLAVPSKREEPRTESTLIRPKLSSLPRIPGFFEKLECKLDASDPECTGILNIVREIRTIPYRSYPNAAAMLLRCLLEQALKYHIKRCDASGWDRLCKANANNPKLSALINHCKSHAQSLFPGEVERLAAAVFDSKGTKTSLDLVCHQPSIVSATPSMLEGLAKGGLFALIQYILKRGDQEPESGQDSVHDV